MPKHERADERHDLHQRAEAEACGKVSPRCIITVGIHPVRPKMQNRLRNADAQIASVVRRYFAWSSTATELTASSGCSTRNFGRRVDGGALGAELGEHVADFIGAALKGKEFR